ncbi:MAG: DUF4126 domain-containing protein, partial [Acidobacteria bacterium]|nr:DUF4126 domain-containing protein [Acidobacteriota bacterium]
MEILLSVGLGVGLAAACGFRIFLPVLVMGLAARAGFLELTENFEWIAGSPALLTVAVAVTCEIVAYYIPWFDNLLDMVAVAGPGAPPRRGGGGGDGNTQTGVGRGGGGGGGGGGG